MLIMISLLGIGSYPSNARQISKNTKYPPRKIAICNTIEEVSKRGLGTNNVVIKKEKTIP